MKTPDYCEGCNQRFAPIDQQSCWGCKDGDCNTSKRRRMEKTPDENKCGMECIRTNAERVCVKPENGQCPRCEQLVEEVLGCIKQLESTVSQVSKALCGKENATLDELLHAADQLKSRLAQAKRERDVAVTCIKGVDEVMCIEAQTIVSLKYKIYVASNLVRHALRKLRMDGLENTKEK